MTIDITNLPRQTIDIKENPLQEIEVKQGVPINPAPSYDGEYEVTPKTTKQTLPTANKILSEDVCVLEIPYFEVSNDSGGHTVTIG